MAVVVFAACCACFVVGQVSADDEPTGGFQLPDQMQMGPENEGFKKYVGSWDVAQQVWMMPGQPPKESKASGEGESKATLEMRYTRKKE